MVWFVCLKDHDCCVEAGQWVGKSESRHQLGGDDWSGAGPSLGALQASNCLSRFLLWVFQTTDHHDWVSLVPAHFILAGRLLLSSRVNVWGFILFLLSPVMSASCQQGTRTPRTGTETPCPAEIPSLLEMLRLKGLVMSVHPCNF